VYGLRDFEKSAVESAQFLPVQQLSTLRCCAIAVSARPTSSPSLLA